MHKFLSHLYNHSADEFSENVFQEQCFHITVMLIVWSTPLSHAALTYHTNGSKENKLLLWLVLSVNSSPWLNDTICCFRHKWRKAERPWKSTTLQLHHMHSKDIIFQSSNMVKDARALISSSKHSPRVLFDTITNNVPPAPPDVPIFSNTDCNRFLRIFTKIWHISTNFMLFFHSLNFILLITMQYLIDHVGNMKPS